LGGLLHRLQNGRGGRGVVRDVRAVHVHVDLALSSLCVPPHISPALAFALAAHGEVGVADEVHVDGRAGGRRGAVSERLEVGSSRRRALVVGVAGAHGLGEAGVAFAEAKLTEGISRAPIHAPIPVVEVV